MAGRILLNSSGAPFRVQPQSRKRFAEQYDDGRLTGEDWLRNVSNVVDLANKVMPIVTPLLSKGQSVKETPFDRAADKAADSVAQGVPMQAPVATPENHLAPVQADPYAQYLAAAQQAANAQTPQELAAAELAMQQGQQQFPTGTMDFMPPPQMPQPGLQQQGLSFGAQQPQPASFDAGLTGMDTLSLPGVGPLARPSYPGMQTQGAVGPQTHPDLSLQGPDMPQPMGYTGAPDRQMAVSDMEQADTDMAAAALDQARSDVEGMRIFNTITEAQAALAMASQSGDREAYRRAAEALEYSPLSDVAPTSVTDYVTGSHIRRAKQQLLARYKAPAAPGPLSARDKAYIDNVRSMIDKRGFDEARAIAENMRKEEDSHSQRTYREKLKAKLGVDTDIAKVRLKYTAPDMKAGISQKRATASQRWQAGRKTRMFNDFMNRNPEVFEGVQLSKTLQAKVAAEVEKEANRNMRMRETEKGKNTRSSVSAARRGLSTVVGRMLAKAEGAKRKADALVSAANNAEKAYMDGKISEQEYDKLMSNKSTYEATAAGKEAEIDALRKLLQNNTHPGGDAVPTSTSKGGSSESTEALVDLED